MTLPGGGDLAPAALASLERCFDGAIPAVLATADADGRPNVTYISKAHRVDAERVALSNQFMSKTARNLAANPRASLLVIDPVTHDEFRLTIVYERTERRGHVFERLRADIDAIAAAAGLQDVFRLRAADIFRVVDVAQVPPNPAGTRPDGATPPAPDVAAVAELAACVSRCADLDTLFDLALDAVDRLLGYEHTILLLADEDGRRLYTIASHGFDAESVGAEVLVGEGMIGTVAARCEPARVGNMLQVAKYTRSIRAQFEEAGGVPRRELAMPGLAGAESRLVVPLQAAGSLVGVLVADRLQPIGFSTGDEQVLGVVASLLASAIEHLRAVEREPVAEPLVEVVDAHPVQQPAGAPGAAPSDRLRVRCFAVDGSVFLGDEYLVKGVAGRILASMLRQHGATGRVDFTNKELRLDRTLELPAYKDNLESRLLLLKRRLDERHAPVRLVKTGRGHVRLVVDVPVELVTEG